MEYVKPTIIDYGDLVELTLASGTVGAEDGAGKTVQFGVDGLGEISVGILP